MDPLLLFCQLLTAGTALTWALEAIKLRRIVENEQVEVALALLLFSFASLEEKIGLICAVGNKQT